MALILKDRVLETTHTGGTGTVTLLGAQPNFLTFSSAIGNGNTTYYTIVDDGDNQWEVGIGTVGAGTLSRDTVLSSSNGGSKVNFGVADKQVFCDYPASKSVYQDANGLVTVPNLATNSASSLTPVLTYNASNSAQTNGATIAGSYLQNVMQNKSGTAGASTNFAVSNDLGTDSTYYGEFGMNSSVFSSGTPADFFSLNNGVYYSGHDGDISIGSGNGYKTYFAWGTTGDKAHVINASGAIGLNTNITGTTNFGTAGYILTSGGSSATPTWTNPTSIVGGAGGSNTQVQYNSSGALAGSANLTFNGTTLTTANDASISGLTVGKGGGAVASNTAVGVSALTANTTGALAIAIGNGALQANTTGDRNTAIGYQSIYTNISGNYNVGVGFGTLNKSTSSNNTAVGYYTGGVGSLSGDDNTLFGFKAGYNNSSGASNTAIGSNAGNATTTGSNNTSVGFQSLLNNTTASNNTAIGYQAGFNNTTGTTNGFFAGYAGYGNTTGNQNTFVGYASGYVNTTGSNNTGIGFGAFGNGSAGVTGTDNIGIGLLSVNKITSGNYNIGIGTQSLFSNTTASNNTAVGYQAGYSNTTGGITAFGWKAGYSNTTADYNTAIGVYAGYSNTTGQQNTSLGYSAGYSNTTAIGTTAIGYQALYNANRTSDTTAYNTALGFQAGFNTTTGQLNTFIGEQAGYLMTTGSKNAIFGSYSGNQGGLDIRTASNYIVLSDGDGNPRQYFNGSIAIFNGTISPVQATTAAAPAYVKGAIYFDTTLNKLRVGGATAWETITSV